jgi:sugar phosphate isomerase/epimerase
MFQTLNTGAIGVNVNGLHDAIVAARLGGFAGVEFRAAEVADLIDGHGAAHVNDLFTASGVRPAAWSHGIQWQRDEATWQAGIAALPRHAAAAAAIGCYRSFQVLPSWSDDRPFDDYWRFCIARLQPIAAILADHGCSLGLEFLGPATLRAGKRHPFIHTATDALELGAAIGPNVGLLLDAYHWYTAHGTLAELRTIRREQIVHVHVNDAPAGIPIDEQQDLVRDLPGETGVIDIGGFLGAVRDTGYDGPVTPEPFKRELQDLPSDAARLVVVKASMDAIWQWAGWR